MRQCRRQGSVDGKREYGLERVDWTLATSGYVNSKLHTRIVAPISLFVLWVGGRN